MHRSRTGSPTRHSGSSRSGSTTSSYRHSSIRHHRQPPRHSGKQPSRSRASRPPSVRSPSPAQPSCSQRHVRRAHRIRVHRIASTRTSARGDAPTAVQNAGPDAPLASAFPLESVGNDPCVTSPFVGTDTFASPSASTYSRNPPPINVPPGAQPTVNGSSDDAVFANLTPPAPTSTTGNADRR